MDFTAQAWGASPAALRASDPYRLSAPPREEGNQMQSPTLELNMSCAPPFHPPNRQRTMKRMKSMKRASS